MSFFKELKRRNVVRVAIAYVVVAWILIEAASVLFPGFGAPDWVFQVFTTLVMLGFPLALIFAWAFELTPDGVKRTAELPAGHALEPRSHRKMDLIIIGLLVVALAVSVGLNIVQRDSTGDAPSVTGDPGQSIAVLPFANRSASEQDAFFVDGMHDELLTQLTKIGSLKVISRTSVMEYKDTTKKIPEIAQELGVANVLEGGVQRVGDRVRIQAQLIHASSDEHLWAESYDRELTVSNLLDIQAEIARAIASALQATLSPEENARLNRQLTDDMVAYDAYLRAMFADRSFQGESREEARMDLEFALERDPDFAAAWALYARTLLAFYWFENPDPELLMQAGNAIDRGRAIDPAIHELDIAEGYYYYWGFRDYDKARAALERALEVAPGDADLVALLAFINRRDGNLEASLEELRRVLELDPLRHESNLTMAEIYIMVYDWDAAQKMVDRGLVVISTSVFAHDVQALLLIERDGDLDGAFEQIRRWNVFDVLYAGFPWWIKIVQEDYETALAHVDYGRFRQTKFGIQPPGLQIGLTHLFAGDLEAARGELEIVRAEFETLREESPEDGRVHRGLCLVYGALRLQEQAREACRLGLEDAVRDAFETGFLRVEVAKGLALAGLTDEALDMIELYLTEPSGYGAVRTQLEPAFRSLHDEPRFQELVERFRNKKLQELSFE